MKFIHLIGACAALSVPAIAGAAQSTPPAAQPTQSKSSKDDPNRIVCRTDDETGSRIAKKKICKTVAQWREFSYQSGQLIEHMSTQVGKPGGG